MAKKATIPTVELTRVNLPDGNYYGRALKEAEHLVMFLGGKRAAYWLRGVVLHGAFIEFYRLRSWDGADPGTPGRAEAWADSDRVTVGDVLHVWPNAADMNEDSYPEGWIGVRVKGGEVINTWSAGSMDGTLHLGGPDDDNFSRERIAEMDTEEKAEKAKRARYLAARRVWMEDNEGEYETRREAHEAFDEEANDELIAELLDGQDGADAADDDDSDGDGDE